ncbi:MAG: hypothetical protein ACI91Q_002459, partial [Gammaproteobacteria bacterium]
MGNLADLIEPSAVFVALHFVTPHDNGVLDVV